MNNELWNRIEAALDARNDPFEDPSIARELAKDPAAERAARQLVQRLSLLPSDDFPHAVELRANRSQPSVRLALVAAVVLFVGLASYAWFDQLEQLAPARSARTIDTLSLVVDQTSPPPPRGSSVVQNSDLVVFWTLEGESR